MPRAMRRVIAMPRYRVPQALLLLPLLLLLLLVTPAGAALVPTDIRAKLTFTNGSATDAAPLVRLALFGAPRGQHFEAAHALGRKGTCREEGETGRVVLFVV